MRMKATAIVYAPDGVVYAAAGQATDVAELPLNGRGVLMSRDGGRHWVNVSASLPKLDARNLAVSPDGHWLYVGTGGGGVYRAPAD